MLGIVEGKVQRHVGMIDVHIHKLYNVLVRNFSEQLHHSNSREFLYKHQVTLKEYSLKEGDASEQFNFHRWTEFWTKETVSWSAVKYFLSVSHTRRTKYARKTFSVNMKIRLRTKLGNNGRRNRGGKLP